MLRRGLLTVCLLLIPAAASAQPERFLPPGSQIFLSWDGFAQHQAAFDKTDLGTMLKGDVGKFLSEFGNFLLYAVDLAFEKIPQLEEHEEIAKWIKKMPAVFSAINQHGLAIGVELRQINPPDAELTIAFAKNGGDGPLAKIVKEAMKGTTIFREEKIAGRVVHVAEFGPVQWGQWSEGDTYVVTVGTNSPQAAVERGVNKGANVTSHPLYKELASAKEHVWSRAYLDTEGIFKHVRDISPQASQLIDEIGLGSLKNITSQAGFEGQRMRSVTDINFSGERKGLLLMTKVPKANLKDLPPLPAELTSFGVGGFDAVNTYDAIVNSIDGGVRVFAPAIADGIKEGIKQMEQLVEVKVKEDLLSCFGDQIVTYATPLDGPLGLGQVAAIKVKDSKKLVESLKKIHNTFPGFPGVEFEFKNKKYEGIDYVELHLGPAAFGTTTFLLHDGWLVYGSFPQPIKAYILRAKGLTPSWNVKEKLDAKIFAGVPKDFASFSYSDPKPAVEQILAWVPTLMGLANMGLKAVEPDYKPFDVGLVPHPLEVTRYLSPSISVTVDQGKRIRYISWSSW